MRNIPTRLLLAAALTACEATPDGYTLLFLGRAPAARVGALNWAPDGERSRLVALDGALRRARAVTDPRLAAPVAVQRLGDRLLVTERTGEGVVFDTTGKPVREWESPFPASLYATDGQSRIVAARSPFYVQFVAEDGNQPLLWWLDTLGRTARGLGTARAPAVPYDAQLENAGAVALDQRGAVYFAPLARDEIVKVDAAGRVVWRATRGVGASTPEESTPGNVALAIGPDGRLYALGSADSSGTRLRLDVLDPGDGRRIATHSLPETRVAIAADRNGRLRILGADSLLGRSPLQRRPASPSL